MKKIIDWRQKLRFWIKRRRSIPSALQEDFVRFFEQAFSWTQEPAACWFGFHEGYVSLVIGNYFLAKLGSTGESTICILVDKSAPVPAGFKFGQVGHSKTLGWLYSRDFTSVKRLANNPALWTAYANASGLAPYFPSGKPKKDESYTKHDKERLSDFWPERGRHHLPQESKFEVPILKSLLKTEYRAVRLSRIGQERFRDLLLVHWERCAVTGCEDPRMLRASHLKPWADSTNNERLDPYNGLLLIPNLDIALDAGLITFDDSGRIKLSPQLDSEDARNLGINPVMKLRSVHKRHRKYLRYQREQVFKR